MRFDRRAVGEVNQSLAALVVIMTCVGLVLSAVHAASSAGAERAAVARAAAQGEICMDEIVRDSAVAVAPGTLSLERAQAVGEGRAALRFAPDVVPVIALRALDHGDEVFLKGAPTDLSPKLTFVVRPVAVLTDNGTLVPGILRVGVAPL
jgi:hypothetical protein